jgi:bifunctional DNA-binding transcriptional regulator/antitoxin component of YhaV-PrlF toxin-antitoxin module
VTLPKELADAFGIEPGDEIEWERAGDVIRVVPAGRGRGGFSVAERLALFDDATRRDEQRWAGPVPSPRGGRAWTRDDLHDRGRAG